MINQKGQAFSVFELMIAAIVAIAILFVLLPLVAPPDIGGNAKTEIASTLTNVETGAFARTQEFTLTQNEIVSSANFDEKGFDATQIVFYGGEFEGVKVESGISTDNTFSYIKSTSNTPTKSRAMVYCSSTGAMLKSTLALVIEDETTAGAINGNIDTLCIANDSQPCCAVILVRK